MKLKFFIPLLFLSACSGNKFIEYYESLAAVSTDTFSNADVVRHTAGRRNRHSNVNVLPKKQVIVTETTEYPERIKGYIVIGQSVFQGTWEPRYLAVQAARQYGADVVVIISKQEGELIKNGVVPMAQPNVAFYSGNVGGQSFHGSAAGVSTGYVNYQYKEKIYKQRASFLKLSKGKEIK